MSGSKQHFGKSTGLACIKERGVASWPFTCFPLHALRLFSCGNKMGGGGGGDDISWQLPASGRDSGGIAAKCPAVTGALGVQCSPGAVTACTGYYEKRHPGRLLLEFP